MNEDDLFGGQARRVGRKLFAAHDDGAGYDWCRFWRADHCWYPEEQDEAGTELAGYPVFTPLDRGICPHEDWGAQYHCPVSAPGPHAPGPHFSDGSRPYGQGGYAYREMVNTSDRRARGEPSRLLTFLGVSVVYVLLFLTVVRTGAPDWLFFIVIPPAGIVLALVAYYVLLGQLRLAAHVGRQHATGPSTPGSLRTGAGPTRLLLVLLGLWLALFLAVLHTNRYPTALLVVLAPPQGLLLVLVAFRLILNKIGQRPQTAAAGPVAVPQDFDPAVLVQAAAPAKVAESRPRPRPAPATKSTAAPQPRTATPRKRAPRAARPKE